MKNKPAETTYFNYRFIFKDGNEVFVPITLDLKDLSYIPTKHKKGEFWTVLAYNQCQNCQLKAKVHPHCPIALNLTDIIPKFHKFKSFESVLIRVESPERIYEKETTLQQALGSLLGIIMVTSGCPTMLILKPMARFHLPFATVEETVYRAVTTYLLGQYLRKKKAKTPDWTLNNLAYAYEQIQTVNMGITDRLRGISEEDANANAVVVLDVFAKVLPSSIFVELQELEYLFQDLIDMD